MLGLAPGGGIGMPVFDENIISVPVCARVRVIACVCPVERVFGVFCMRTHL